ncbi:hypothetical protein C8J57DRAFT_1672507 [Mycena rebaudengoi]|nr:hypothetical protein C8J57DRAFT_1672507 [Mycena rebaudengoi]
MDRERTWWGGGTSSGTIMATIQKHFPGAKMGIENIGNAGNDVSSSGVTNRNGRWNGLVEAHKRLPEGSKKGNIAKGIARASTQNTELNLMTKEFTPKIQIISALESVCTRIYDAGSADSRQAEAILSSRLIYGR